MNLPQARAWKKFRIGDLYYKVSLGRKAAEKRDITSQTRSSVYSLPVVNAKIGDNGIMYYGRPECFESEEMCIDIIQNGAVATGKVYPQPQRTGVLWDAYLLKARNHVDTDNSLVYIAGSIERSIRKRYDRDNKAIWDKVKDEWVCLPVGESRQLDMSYMELYISELEKARVQEVCAYLRATGLDDCVLTAEEAGVLKELSDGTLKTSMITVGDLFAVNGNPQLNKESFEFSVDAEYPYFTRTVFNNGILGYVNYLDESHKIPGGSLAVGMLGMQFFYMVHDYYAGQFTKSVRLKTGVLSERTGLFFATLFNKAKGEFQKGLVRDFERLFTSLEIRLPVAEDGAIDYAKMDNLVSACMKRAMKGVIDWIG